MKLNNYFEHGTGIAEDEVNGTLNVAVLEVMAAGVVAESVLGSVESASSEVGLVP